MFFFLVLEMKIIYQNLRRGEIKVKVESTDDLWYLSHIIEKGDLVKGQTIRKIRLGVEERKAKTIKKRVFISIGVEKIEFKEDLLKALGKIIECPEDIQKGNHHSFNIEIGSIITIRKDRWLKFHLDRLREATVIKQPSILICVLDREEAIFALSKREGYDILNSFKGEVAKKAIDVKEKGGFYEEIIKKLEDYICRYAVGNIIVASPAFWKEELFKRIKDEKLKNKIVLATCSSVSKNAIDEVLKRPEVKEILKQVRTAKEMNLVEELLIAIAKKGAVAYGIKETEMAANAGAVKTLLVTDKLIKKMQERGEYNQLDHIMKLVDQTKGEIHIISSEHDGGKRLDGLGGIGALLRYKIT